MTHFAYIVAGYGLTAAVLAGYSAWVLGRRRALARTLGLAQDAPVPPAAAPPAPGPAAGRRPAPPG